MGLTRKQERSQVILHLNKEASSAIFANMESGSESRGFEDSRVDHQRSNERRNGIAGPRPSMGGADDRIERRRRNAVASKPFLEAFLTNSKQQQADGSRSR